MGRVPSDEFDSWGYATYYFETADDGWPRQVEVYDAGPVLRYGPAYPEDRFGGFGQAQLDEFEDWAEWEISADEFERPWIMSGEWSSHTDVPR